MHGVKLGLGQINTTIGDMKGNADKIIEYGSKLAEDGCDIITFPEMCMTGYPAEDLVLWQRFEEAQATQLARVAMAFNQFEGCCFIIGVCSSQNGIIYNSAFVIDDETAFVVPKEQLPTYDVFDDGRTFGAWSPEQGTTLKDHFGDIMFDMEFDYCSGSLQFGTAICEDLWTPSGPVVRRAMAGCELIFVLSASPYRHGVMDVRKRILKAKSADTISTIAYVNAVGGNGALVFDGGSMVAQNGTIVHESIRWEEAADTCMIDLDQISAARSANTTWRNNFDRTNAAPIHTLNVQASKHPVTMDVGMSQEHRRTEELCDATNAIVLGLNDYYEKIDAWSGVTIALSGGKDSSLCLLLTDDWARRVKHETGERPEILCVSMPTEHNSDETKNIAEDLTAALAHLAGDDSIRFVEMPIQDAYEAERANIEELSGGEIDAITDQNIQARIRGSRMWNISNELDLLWIQTGNMSEKAVGYCTMGGDMMGSFSLISNLSKPWVNLMIRRYIEEAEVGDCTELMEILSELMATKPSAELADDQSDEDDLMPFVILDACYELMVAQKRGITEAYKILCSEWDVHRLITTHLDYEPPMLSGWVWDFSRRFFTNIFKWVQSPLGVHLDDTDLDHERALRIPVVQSDEWMREAESYEEWLDMLEGDDDLEMLL